MLKIISGNLWDTIQKKAKHAEHRRAAIAYVTDPTLLPLRSGDLLVTDASDASIASGRTSAITLEKYFKAEVELFNLPYLHAKVLVLDDWAVVGSANASHQSAAVYFEAAMLSDRPELTGQADKLVTFLANAGTPIDEPFIKRILKIPVVKTWGLHNAPRTRTLAKPSLDQTFWLVSIHGDAEYAGNAEIVEGVAEKVQKKMSSKAGIVDWFWWSGKARFPTTAREGDIVIVCWRPRAKISTTRGVEVFRHGRIAKIFQEPGVMEITFHCIWPPECDDTALSWSAFQKLAERAGITRKLSYNSTVELTSQQSSALFEIWPR